MNDQRNILEPVETFDVSFSWFSFTLSCCVVHWFRKHPAKGLRWMVVATLTLVVSSSRVWRCAEISCDDASNTVPVRLSTYSQKTPQCISLLETRWWKEAEKQTTMLIMSPWCSAVGSRAKEVSSQKPGCPSYSGLSLPVTWHYLLLFCGGWQKHTLM